MGMFSGIFKDGAGVLAKRVFQLCSPAISLSKFLEGCNTVKLKPLFKLVSKTNPSSYNPDVLPLLSKVIKKLFLKNYPFPEKDHPFSTYAKLRKSKISYSGGKKY